MLNNFEILISTQNIKNNSEIDQLIKDMNIKSKNIVINQCQKNTNVYYKNVINMNEKGLSKSRNKAINESTAEIILFADDDVRYHDDYEQLIEKSFEKNKNADIICFYVRSLNKKRKTKRVITKKVGYIKSMRITSFEICCRRKSIIENNIKFNENFGSGTKYNRGEEQIFLFEAIRKGLKIIFINKEIGTVKQTESSWFKKYDSEYFRIQGRVYKELTPKYYKFWIYQYAIRKYKEYHKNISLKNVIKNMMIGANE